MIIFTSHIEGSCWALTMVRLADSFPPLPPPQKGYVRSFYLFVLKFCFVLFLLLWYWYHFPSCTRLDMLVWIKVATATVGLGIALISLYLAIRRCRSNNNEAPPRIELQGAIPGFNFGNLVWWFQRWQKLFWVGIWIFVFVDYTSVVLVI